MDRENVLTLRGTVPFAPKDDSPESRIAEMFATGKIDEEFLRDLAKATAMEPSTHQLFDVLKDMREIYGPEVSERLILERSAKLMQAFMMVLISHTGEDGLLG